MPIPFILGAVAVAAAAAGGVGSGVSGAKKMKDANDKMKSAEIQHSMNERRFEKAAEATNKAMDELGTLEAYILESFGEFSNTIEKIQNRPEFKAYKKDGVELPRYNAEALNEVSISANVLLAGVGSAAAGMFVRTAASGTLPTALTSVGIGYTGTAISTLGGAAATNATLAALGGGSLAAGGGGMALGATILSTATFGVGLLAAGVIVNMSGGKTSDKADQAYYQMKEAEKTIDSACEYLNDLKSASVKYEKSLTKVNDKYKEIFGRVSYAVNNLSKRDWNDFSEEEKIATQNSVLLVGLLYKMCQVNLVNKADDEDEMSTVNETGVDEAIYKANTVMSNLK